jgi:hypothetical protein
MTDNNERIRALEVQTEYLQKNTASTLERLCNEIDTLRDDLAFERKKRKAIKKQLHALEGKLKYLLWFIASPKNFAIFIGICVVFFAIEDVAVDTKGVQQWILNFLVPWIIENMSG